MKAGIPVVSINSGSDIARRIGTLAHIGQPEEKAGFQAGRRLVAAGAGTGDALCVNQEVGNVGLDRRCAGLRARDPGGRRHAARARRRHQGPRRDAPPGRRRPSSPARRRRGPDAQQHRRRDRGGRRAARRPASARSTSPPTVLRAIRTGRIEFAVDQQPYLQGYLPVVFLAERARYGLFPAQGEVVPTGPNFITAANAAQAERLSLQGIR